MSNLNSAGCNLIPISSALSLVKGHLPLCCPSCPLPSLLQAEQSSRSLSCSYCGAQNRAEWDKSLPHPDASQDTGGWPAWQLTHIQFAINSNPQISFCRAALQPLVLQSVCIISFQLEKPALLFIKFHTPGDYPATQSIQISL